MLATAAEGAISLWEVVSGKQIRQLPGHRGNVHSLAFTPDGRALLSAGEDGVAVLWDATGRGQALEPGQSRPSRKELEAAWEDLAGSDAGRADRAFWSLVDAPRQAVPLLRQRLRPASPVDRTRLARLLADLDSDSFPTREQATRDLAELGSLAEPGLRQRLTGRASPEVRRRIERLLMQGEEGVLTAGQLRGLRALQVLERIASTEARQLLESLGKGEPAAPLTREAKLALQRLQPAAAAGPASWPGEQPPGQ
jgi:hypothetical protein